MILFVVFYYTYNRCKRENSDPAIHKLLIDGRSIRERNRAPLPQDPLLRFTKVLPSSLYNLSTTFSSVDYLQ